MKAFVTGGTGFIGGHVVDLLLKENHKVRLFSRRHDIPERLKGKDVEFFKGDLEDFQSVIDAMQGMEVFYHIGEIKNVNRTASEKNVKLMGHIIENLKDKRVRRLVFISSITVAGIPSEIPASEDTVPKVILKDHYTSYKRACEKLITEKADVEYAIIRPAPVYGPGSRYLGRLIDAVEKIGPIGFPFVGDARNLAPLIYVKDLARAIYLSGIRTDAVGHVFNLTDGHRHSWFEFLNTIAESLGKKVRIIPLSPLFLRIPAIFFDFFSGIFGIELDLSNYMAYFSRDLFFENSKARSLLMWEPEFTLNNGVKKMVKGYRD
jgi:nucleoside-diphosphate-sugar epimerase